MISLIHPTRSRPERSILTTNKWLANAGCDVELIVCCDNSDPRLSDYLQIHQTVHVNNNASAIEAINFGATKASGDILIVVSDDSDCPDNWGKKILNVVNGKRDYVLKVNDGIQRWIITMPVMDRVYYERFGYIYFPDYKHMFADTEFTHVADVMHKVITRNDLNFPHRHYSVMKQRPDEVSRKADSTWDQGKQLYLKRVRERFGLPNNIDVMNISDNSHYRWLKNETRKFG